MKFTKEEIKHIKQHQKFLEKLYKRYLDSTKKVKVVTKKKKGDGMSDLSISPFNGNGGLFG